VLIVGVAVLILERMFSCFNRIKISKCCGGELQLASPPKKGLNDSDEQEIQKKVDHILEIMNVKNQTDDKIEKRDSQNKTV